MITVDTKLVALLGYPLRQSLSYIMQNAAYAAHGLDFHYFPVETSNKSLAQIVAAIRHMNFVGCGVTKPDKLTIMTMLDEIDELAEKIGAVNTVVKYNGLLKGYNTDGIGCLRSLKENMDRPIKSAKFVSLGAGGSARAVCSTLAHYGSGQIFVYDIDDKASKDLVDDINRHFSPVARRILYADERGLAGAIKGSDVIMNHTGVGMKVDEDATPIPKQLFHPSLLAFDAIYNPSKTRFLREAEEQGCKILNGLGMLVYQGAAQFEMWTGHPDPSAIMFASLENRLRDDS